MSTGSVCPAHDDCRQVVLFKVLEETKPRINYNPFTQVHRTILMTGGEGDQLILQEQSKTSQGTNIIVISKSLKHIVDGTRLINTIY